MSINLLDDLAEDLDSLEREKIISISTNASLSYIAVGINSYGLINSQEPIPSGWKTMLMKSELVSIL